MALKIYEKFAPRANVGDTNYPNGSIKNETAPGAKDGTPLDADWGNDYAGADAALFAEVGITPNGDPDTVLSSQRLNALKISSSKVAGFTCDNVSDMKSGVTKSGTVDWSILIGARVTWQGYYAESDGGSNWGIIKSGTHTEDGGSIFSIDANTYVEANLKGGKVSVLKFGAIRGANADTYTGTDTSVQIQACLDYAENLLILKATSVSNPLFPTKGGTTVTAPQGCYLISQIEIPSTVSFVGYGRDSTLFISQYDGQIMRNKSSDNAGFDKTGVKISDFSIRGDLTKSSQCGLDTLRLFDCTVERITLINIGGPDAFIIRQALVSSFNQIVTSYCAGNGIVIDKGVVSWDDLTPVELPSNANTIDTPHAFANNGAGLVIRGLANGNTIRGGSIENSYASSGDNAGYNIEVTAQTFAVNTINGTWTEGGVKAHIYVNAATSSSPLEIINWKNISNGSTGHVDRALIVDKGIVNVKDSFGQAEAYKEINGSIRPFRRNVAGGVASLRVTDASGSTITDGIFVEDEDGNDDSGSKQRNLNRSISGIRFDSTFKSNDSRTLDDYQEGVWSPTLTTDGVDFDSVTYDSITQGTYVKIGKLVTLTGVIRTDSVTKGSANGNVVLSGLPFVSSRVGSTDIATSSSWDVNHPSSGYMLPSSNSMFLLYRATANGGTSNLAVSDVATGSDSNLIRFTAQYETSL